MAWNDKDLENEIDRQLKALPELTAPDGLVERVMATLEAQEKLPWFQRSWQTWPGGMRWSFLLSLMVLFGGLCYAGWEVSHFTSATIGKKFAAEFLSLGTIWNALNAVINAGLLAFQQLGTGFLAGLCVAIGLGYAMFLSLGALYVRIAFAERR